MENQKWIRALGEIKLSEKAREELIDYCTRRQHSANILLRYARLAAVCMCAALSLAVCCPAYAAYHLYQEKNIYVYFEKDITEERIAEIGEVLERMEGVYSVRFVSADEAWDVFQNQYLTGEYAYLRDLFAENPLSNSYNYHVTVELDADGKEIREQIQKLEGVRAAGERE